MWLKASDENLLFSDEELRTMVLSNQSVFKLIILDGPTMCGKTRFVKSLPPEITTVVGFYQVYEDFCDWLNSGKCLIDYKQKTIQHYQWGKRIVCFEDIDMNLSGKETTQEEFLLIFTALVETSTVILTGIDIKKKCPALINSSQYMQVKQPDYYKWIDG